MGHSNFTRVTNVPVPSNSSPPERLRLTLSSAAGPPSRFFFLTQSIRLPSSSSFLLLVAQTGQFAGLSVVSSLCNRSSLLSLLSLLSSLFSN